MKKMFKKTRLIVILIITTLLVVGCTQDSDVEELEANVFLRDLTYEPAELTVSAGTTVTFINEDNETHTIVAGTRDVPTGEFEETLEPGESFSFLFEVPGAYDYYSSVYPGMEGRIIVEE